VATPLVGVAQVTVWDGDTHGYDTMVPNARASRAADDGSGGLPLRGGGCDLGHGVIAEQHLAVVEKSSVDGSADV